MYKFYIKMYNVLLSEFYILGCFIQKFFTEVITCTTPYALPRFFTIFYVPEKIVLSLQTKHLSLSLKMHISTFSQKTS